MAGASSTTIIISVSNQKKLQKKKARIKLSKLSSTEHKDLLLSLFSAAVKATLEGITTHHCRIAYEFVLEEQFQVLDSNTCEEAPAILAGTSFLALWEPETSEKALELFIGESYLVSGFHREEPAECGGQTLWDVATGVISTWGDKYSKKLSKWVESGNKSRGCASR